jgi:hypothetical protein
MTSVQGKLSCIESGTSTDEYDKAVVHEPAIH